ncbi:MAG: hypothetical protein J6B06_04830 [Lachnospiraceae bacterium]|nr:hypothetical protein [Lachnospiraceae bacterium]
MTTILVIKEQLKKFYGKYDIYVTAVLKFFGALITIMLINANIGYMDRLKNTAIIAVVALLCSIIPVGGMVLICALFVLAHLYAVSLELAAVALAVFLLMFLVYIRFDSSLGYIVLLTPVLFWLKIPYLMPLLAGLTGGFAAAVPAGMGVVVYFLLDYAKTNAPALSNSSTETLLQNLTMIIDGLVQNKLMMLTVAAFVITTVIVFLIKSMSIDYSWTIAIGVGMVVNMVILLVGAFSLDLSASAAGMIFGNIIAALIMLVLQYFIFAVDYTRTEKVSFEDDDYVYYVKAVPKMSVSTPHVNVKRINAQRTRKKS